MSRCTAAISLILTLALAAAVAQGAPALRATVLWEASCSMDVLPEEAANPWFRLGGAPLFHFDSGTILLNDNTRSDRIAYQTLRGRIQAEHRVSLGARMKVLSNLEGRAVTLEVARPGMQAVLRLFPDRLELMERLGNNDWHWLASAPVDLSRFREVELRKHSNLEDPDETLEVLVDGVVVLRARPTARGEGLVGRLVMGSVANDAIGASEWDRVDYRVERLVEPTPPVPVTLGALKAAFRSEP